MDKNKLNMYVDTIIRLENEAHDAATIKRQLADITTSDLADELAELQDLVIALAHRVRDLEAGGGDN
jgi:cell division protein FtsB